MEDAPLYSNLAKGPENNNAYWVYTNDNVRLRVGLWSAPKNLQNKGTVFLFPGITGYIERSGLTAIELNKLGYSSFVIDWRGHGLSDQVSKNNKVAHITSYSLYQNDVEAMISAAEELNLPKPWFLLANSMGACIGLRTISRVNPFTSCIFIAPMWGINMNMLQRIAAWPISWAFHNFGKGDNYAPNYNDQTYVSRTDFKDNNLTSNPEIYKHLITLSEHLPQLQRGGPSMSWLYQSLLECHNLKKIRSPDIPTLVIRPEIDDVIDTKAIDNRMDRWISSLSHTIKLSKHDMLMEKEEVRSIIFKKVTEHFTLNTL
jgi:lysophospholipase